MPVRSPLLQRPLVVLALLMGAPLVAHADTIYQYRDAQGHLVLSDEKPPASARQVHVRQDVSSTVNGPSPASSNPSAGVPLASHANAPAAGSSPDGGAYTTVSPTTPTGNPSLDAFNQRQAERAQQQSQNDDAVAKAQADLDAALQDQKTGQVVQDGEQTYRGYAETYEQRQQAMADRVNQAQAALLNAQVAAKP